MVDQKYKELMAKVVKAVKENDDEAAHGCEDVLHQAVLMAIRDGSLGPLDAQELAAFALSTLDMDFARWCA